MKYIYRLMTQKLPGVASRPGMFISVGPSGFTVTALIGLAGNIERVVTDDFMGNGMMAGLVARIMGYWAGMSPFTCSSMRSVMMTCCNC